MSERTYTAITFAPVQGFIEKSRKLRDLYGSSFILSYLAQAICEQAEQQGHWVISPALTNLTQGTPNQIVIQGDFPKIEAKTAFSQHWKSVIHTCRQWIEDHLPDYDYSWQRDWNLWASHAWEFFWAQGNSIGDARKNLNYLKRSRNWTGINWKGESSTLSGADAIAWPGLGRNIKPQDRRISQEDQEIRRFYRELSQIQSLGAAFVDETEQLSIPELTKRLITYQAVAQPLTREIPDNFRDLNRLQTQQATGWFQGDGDSIGAYLRRLHNSGQDEAKALNTFSAAMRSWGTESLAPSLTQGRLIYAGGDDFLGVFYSETLDNTPGAALSARRFTAKACLDWFYQFPSRVWQQHRQEITVSVGFVWAGAGVPQRDVLQHCREAEQAAKRHGRNRLALRVLFNSGNHLEWTCPWRFLQPILEGYRDRNGGDNWSHLYNDLAALSSRHAFVDRSIEVPFALFGIYFPQQMSILENRDNWFNREDGKDQQLSSGILGERSRYDGEQAIHQAWTDWIRNLGQVGFHLCSSI